MVPYSPFPSELVRTRFLDIAAPQIFFILPSFGAPSLFFMLKKNNKKQGGGALLPSLSFFFPRKCGALFKKSGLFKLN
jgi:hypothetical protein